MPYYMNQPCEVRHKIDDHHSLISIWSEVQIGEDEYETDDIFIVVPNSKLRQEKIDYDNEIKAAQLEAARIIGDAKKQANQILDQANRERSDTFDKIRDASKVLKPFGELYDLAATMVKAYENGTVCLALEEYHIQEVAFNEFSFEHFKVNKDKTVSFYGSFKNEFCNRYYSYDKNTYGRVFTTKDEALEYYRVKFIKDGPGSKKALPFFEANDYSFPELAVYKAELEKKREQERLERVENIQKELNRLNEELKEKS